MGNDVKLGITAEDVGLQAALTAATVSVKTATEEMAASFEGLTSKIAGIGTAFAAIGAVLAGGEMFKEAVTSTVNLAKESVALGKQVGISATDASVLKVALNSVFVSQETLSNSAGKITQTLKKNEQAFTDLGVATRDSNGNLRSTLDITLDVNAALLTFKEGTDRNVEATKIYGRSWQANSDVLKLTSASIDEAREKAQALGLIVGEQSVAQSLAYRQAMNGVHEVAEGVAVTVGNALIPALTAMGQWISDNGVPIVNGFRAAIYAVYAAFSFLKEGVTVAVDFIAGKIDVLGAEFSRLSSVADAIKNGGSWDAVKTAWAQGTSNIEAASKQMSAAIQDDMAAAAASRDKFFGSMSGDQTAIQKKEGGATSEGGDDKQKSQLKELENILAQKKVAYEMDADAHGQTLQFSKEQEMQYWQDLLAGTTLNAADRVTIETKVANEQLKGHGTRGP
jgi:hypothetical protein